MSFINQEQELTTKDATKQTLKAKRQKYVTPRGQGGAHRQGYDNLADCDPCISINTFDHNSTHTGTIPFFATVSESSHRLPPLVDAFFCCSGNLLYSVSTQVRQMISFLTVTKQRQGERGQQRNKQERTLTNKKRRTKHRNKRQNT